MPLGKIPRTFITPRKTYKDALTPTQAEEMGKFLSTLFLADDLAKVEGVKPDIESFMKSWRGLPISVEGKRVRERLLQSEYCRRRKARAI